MPDSVFETRRKSRKHTLEALHDETGSRGGTLAAPRVIAYCADPLGAPPREYAYVGGLALRRFYVDPSKPNGAERQGLWTNLRNRLGQPVGTAPAAINSTSVVADVQAMAELMP